MAETLKLIDVNAEAVTRDWLAQFDAALTQRNVDAATGLFLKDGHWRDLLAFSWHIETMTGVEAIAGTLRDTIGSIQPANFRIAADRTPPRIVTRAGREVVEAIFAFDTAMGPRRLNGPGFASLGPADISGRDQRP